MLYFFKLNISDLSPLKQAQNATMRQRKKNDDKGAKMWDILSYVGYFVTFQNQQLLNLNSCNGSYDKAEGRRLMS